MKKLLLLFVTIPLIYACTEDEGSNGDAIDESTCRVEELTEIFTFGEDSETIETSFIYNSEGQITKVSEVETDIEGSEQYVEVYQVVVSYTDGKPSAVQYLDENELFMTGSITFDGDLVSKVTVTNFPEDDNDVASTDETRFFYTGTQMTKVEEWTNEDYDSEQGEFVAEELFLSFTTELTYTGGNVTKEVGIEEGSSGSDVYEYSYDSNPNPLKDNFALWLTNHDYYLLLSENNVVTASETESGESPFVTSLVYTYNDAGLPVSATVTYEDVSFDYEFTYDCE